MLKMQLYIYLYALVIQMFLLIAISKTSAKHTLASKVFRTANIFNTALLILEASAWILTDQSGTWVRLLNEIVTTGVFALNSFPAILLIIYFDIHIFRDLTVVKKRARVYAIPVILFLIMSLTNFMTGFIFRITADNTYIRGPGMVILTSIVLCIVLIYTLNISKHFKTVEGRLVSVLLMLSVIPCIGALIQIVFYGIPALWTLMTLLLLFVYILVEREEMMRDTLTGLATRGQFELRLRQKLKKDQPFSLLMIDLDQFKPINDTYGHDEGDQALMTVARLLERSIKRIDLACRYGGDEFMILLESRDPSTSQMLTERILETLDVFNQKKTKPYAIFMSIGSHFIEHPKNASEIQLLSIVDQKMYDNKKSNHRSPQQHLYD